MRRFTQFFALYFGMALCLPPFAARAASADCGTLIIPTGLGISSGADITGFNPLLVNSLYNMEAASLMFQPLFWVNGNTLEIDWSRSIASSITTPDSGLTYDVKMRPWIWSDGTPVTSADVAYSWHLIQALGPAYAGYGAGGMPEIVKSLQVISPEEFTLTLKRKVNPQWFIYNGLGQLLPLPEHVWRKFSTDEIYQHQSDIGFFQVVDGPMRPVALNIGQDMEFAPNESWPGGHLNFDRLIFKFVESDGATLQQLEAGELDMINVPMALWNVASKLPGYKLITQRPGLSFNLIALNFRNPQVDFFNDLRVRQAMADAINQQEMIDVIDHGKGQVRHSPVSPVPLTFVAPQLQGGKYPVGYDPAKAKALLAQAGFSPGPDGVLQKAGKRLSFVYLDPGGSAASAQMTMMIQDYLRRAGIEMKVRQIEFNQLLALLNNPHGAWQAAGLGMTSGAYPTGEEMFKTGSFENSGGYSDKKMDALIDASTDQPGLQGLFDYQIYASEQQPVIFLGTANGSMLANQKIVGAENFVDPLYNYYPDALSCPAGALP